VDFRTTFRAKAIIVAYQGKLDRQDADGFEKTYFDIVSGGGIA